MVTSDHYLYRPEDIAPAGPGTRAPEGKVMTDLREASSRHPTFEIRHAQEIYREPMPRLFRRSTRPGRPETWPEHPVTSTAVLDGQAGAAADLARPRLRPGLAFAPPFAGRARMVGLDLSPAQLDGPGATLRMPASCGATWPRAGSRTARSTW